MRGDILVKIFASALAASGVVIGWLIYLIWDAFIREWAEPYPIVAALGVVVFAALCLPQIVGGLLAWRFGTVARGMALEPEGRGRDHIVLRIFMGLVGLVLAGIVGLSGVTLAFDFGFSGVCGIVLLILAIVGPRKVAGAP